MTGEKKRYYIVSISNLDVMNFCLTDVIVVLEEPQMTKVDYSTY
jgi:hypothetical protein